MEENAKRKMQFLELYCMVMADGIVHPKEMEVLYRIGKETYQLTDSELTIAVKNSGSSPFVPDDYEDRIRLLYEMALIAWADGVLEQSERDLLCRYAKFYMVSDDQIDAVVDFLLAEAQKNVSEDEIIAQFK